MCRDECREGVFRIAQKVGASREWSDRAKDNEVVCAGGELVEPFADQFTQHTFDAIPLHRSFGHLGTDDDGKAPCLTVPPERLPVR